LCLRILSPREQIAAQWLVGGGIAVEDSGKALISFAASILVPYANSTRCLEVYYAEYRASSTDVGLSNAGDACEEYAPRIAGWVGNLHFIRGAIAGHKACCSGPGRPRAKGHVAPSISGVPSTSRALDAQGASPRVG